MQHISNQIQTNILNIRNQIIPSLTPQAKKILMIAGAAFSFLAALYLIRKHFSASKPQEELIKKSPVPPHSPTPDTTEDPDLQKPQPPPVTPEDSPTNPTLHDASIEIAQSEADTKKAQEETDAKKAQEETDAKKAQEETDAKKAQEEADAKKAQEETDAKKAQEEADAKKAQIRAAEDRKAKKIVNILFTGKSRSGKSTQYEVLKDTFHVPPHPTMFHSTREPILCEFKLGEYQLRILDTPGLSETVSTTSGLTKRSDDEIASLIDEQVNKIFGGYGHLDVAVFACRAELGVQPEDILSIDKMVPRISSATKKFLMLTGLETKSEEEKSSLATQVEKSQNLDFQKKFGGTNSILFSGALDRESVKYKDSSVNRLRNIVQMKEKVIEALIGDRMTEQEKTDGKKARAAEFENELPKFIDKRKDFVDDSDDE